MNHVSEHYAALGLKSDASLADIKKAFRQKASQFHPDRNTAEDAPARFRAVQEAYEVLSDDAKRNRRLVHIPMGRFGEADELAAAVAFLASPLEFSRVTSGFSMRLHPISGMWKQHKGIDFAAPVGTPIRAVGDGVIDFAGTQGGYGNVLVVQHGSVYSTAYAHLSRMAPGIRRGSRVVQGEVIGYVGTTGRSTGPHLHYEVMRNDRVLNPTQMLLQTTASAQ